jgi:hypothetical protein
LRKVINPGAGRFASAAFHTADQDDKKKGNKKDQRKNDDDKKQLWREEIKNRNVFLSIRITQRDVIYVERRAMDVEAAPNVRQSRLLSRTRQW